MSRWVREGPAPNLDALLGVPPPDAAAAELRNAAGTGQESVVRSLLADPRDDVDSADSEGRTALWWAAWKGHAVVALLLVDGGASIERPGGRDERWTPVLAAQLRGHTKLANQLVVAAEERRRRRASKSTRDAQVEAPTASDVDTMPPAARVACRPAAVGVWYWDDALALAAGSGTGDELGRLRGEAVN
jgi:hypothetical protein